MKPEYEQEIAANLERAEKSIQAAKELATSGFYDFAASRSYYAAFILQPLPCYTKGWNSAGIAGLSLQYISGWLRQASWIRNRARS